jgi:hypothetical protein
LATSGFALPPAGAVASAAFNAGAFSGDADGACAAALTVHANAIASNCGPLRLDFTVVLLFESAGGYCAGASLGEKAKTFFPSANVTVLAFAICDPSLA